MRVVLRAGGRGIFEEANKERIVRRSPLFNVVVLVASCLIATVAFAQVYKWVDKDGRTQYSDQPPPPGVEVKKVGGATSPSVSATQSAAVKSLNEKDQEFRQRRIAQDEKTKKETKTTDETQRRNETCELAKSNLRTFEAGGRIARTNDKGEREFFTDEEIYAERVRAKARVEEACKE